jgi:hypothetical protein
MNPMKRFLFALSLTLGLLAFGADCAHGQVVYGLSATTYDANNVVYNYSMTEGDYYANLYYDMAVEGYTYDFTGNLALTGASQLAVGRAEVWTQAAGTVGNCVGAFTRHYVGAYFGYVYYGSYYYSDPFGFSRFASTGYGGSGSFASAGPYSYVTYNILYLGSTAVCQTVPDNRPPVITGLGPGGGTPGQTVGVTITGSGFGTNPSVQAGNGVSVNVTGASDTQITANFAVAANAATGGRTVTVTKNGLTSNGVGFTVGDPTPVITSVAPGTVYAGASQSVVIQGSGFGVNPTVQVSGVGVSIAVSSASATAIYCTMTVADNATLGGRTVTVVSNGSGGNGFFHAPGGGGASANASLTVQVTRVREMTPFLNLSTGDPASARTIAALIEPPSVDVRVRFSVAAQRNVGGTAQATLTVPEKTDRDIIITNVKAGPSGSSGVFAVRVETSGVDSTNGCEVRVPPQILLQMLRKEARGLENTNLRKFLSWTMRNRFGNTAYFNGQNTYEAAIRAAATWDSSFSDGQGTELDAGASVFAATSVNDPINGDPTGGCQGFWSPTPAQWLRVKEALASKTNQIPGNIGLPFDYFHQPHRTQVVYFKKAGTNETVYPNQDVPAFLFVRMRQPGDPSVVQLD